MLERLSARMVIAIATLAVCACGENRQPLAPTATPPIATPTAGPTPTVVREPAQVQGTVLDYQTQKPVPGAVVAFARSQRIDGTLVDATEAIADANGRYSLPPRRDSRYLFLVNNRYVGDGYPVNPRNRADLMVHTGTCIARYGLVMDAMTFLPIAGARVTSSGFASGTTDSEGWYRIDWGCPASGGIGFNTTFLTATHPAYQSRQQVLGRGVSGVLRSDFTMNPL